MNYDKLEKLASCCTIFILFFLCFCFLHFLLDGSVIRDLLVFSACIVIGHLCFFLKEMIMLNVLRRILNRIEEELSNPMVKVEVKNEDCSICMEVLNACVMLPCGHKFHNECVSKWFEESATPTCPLCRQCIQNEEV